jgi:3-methylfumaryl-CoA hydratase
MVSESIDVAYLESWVGRQEEARDVVTPELVKRFCATLDLPGANLAHGAPAPLGVHWCLALSVAQTADIAPDGHPRRGGFLPPVRLPRRMWAGGELLFDAPLCVGDAVRRVSRVESVAVKEGRSGPLCFVTVRHELSSERGIALRERHDIVYKGIDANGVKPREEKPPNVSRWRRGVDASAVLLFRYSALTFNGHRIHYDRTYCIEEERYPGLVFHGPLQATLLLQFGAEIAAPPAAFEFRAVAPMFDGGQIGLNACEAEGGLCLWTTDQSGNAAMIAKARLGKSRERALAEDDAG